MRRRRMAEQPPDPGMTVKMAPPGLADLDRLLNGHPIDEAVVEELCDFVDARHDCADFRALTLLRIAHSDNTAVSAGLRDRIRTTLVGFRYWMDESGTDSMCFWSENHQVIFAAAEYLAGQGYPDAVFTNPTADGRLLSGKDRMARARRRLETWCEHRLRFGFTEWCSNTYYEEDAAALALLIDLAEDDGLVRKATMILDLVVLDMALHRFERWFVGSAGRAYEAQKKDPRAADTLELSDHFFGVPRDHWDLSRMSGVVITSSYEVPEVLRQIADSRDDALVRESFGLNLAEVTREVGSPEDLDSTGPFFWLMEAFTTPESIRTTMAMFKAWHMRTNHFLSPLSAFARAPSRLLPSLVRLLNPATQGVAIQRADVTTWRTRHGLLSSAQGYQPGGFGDQQHLWQATLPGGINVFATHPGAPMFDDAARSFSPSAWVGNGINPHVGQDRGVLLSLHDLRMRRGYLERRRLRQSHLYWPVDQFSEVETGGHAGGGTWLAARAASGYLGVVSTSPLTEGSEPDELVQRGDVTGWVVVLGNADQDGTFDDWSAQVRAIEVALRQGFADRVVAARNEQRRVEILQRRTKWSRHGRRPFGTRGSFPTALLRTGWPTRPAAHTVLLARVSDADYELDFGNDFTLDGEVVPARHPRFDTPFVTAPRFPEQLHVEHDGHTLELNWHDQSRRHGPATAQPVTMPSHTHSTPLEIAVALCDDIVEQSAARPVLPWMWGPALLGFALSLLDEHLGDSRYESFLLRFADHHLAYPPRIDYSDHVAPALITWRLQQSGHNHLEPLTTRALEYIRNAPRAIDDAVNHLGTSRWNWIYPRSIWVDSLMMFSVFPAMYGRAESLPELVDFAARQPRLYAQRMLDADTNLWHHSYWVKAKRPYPPVFWGRGNGWVVAALPMILDQLPVTHPERPVILSLLSRTSEALRSLQLSDGTWPTILAGKRRSGPSRHGYRELSATALISSGWLHAVREGYLPTSFRVPAENALTAVSSAVRRHHGRLVLPEVSGPTIPVPVFPRLGYLWTPTGLNHPWGVAAFVMAAINADHLADAS